MHKRQRGDACFLEKNGPATDHVDDQTLNFRATCVVRKAVDFNGDGGRKRSKIGDTDVASGVEQRGSFSPGLTDVTAGRVALIAPLNCAVMRKVWGTLADDDTGGRMPVRDSLYFTYK